MQEIQAWSLIWEDPLEKEIAAHSRILAWEITWTEEPGRLQSMELQKSQTQLSNWKTTTTMYTVISSTNSDGLTSSFPIWNHCTTFAFLIAVARTSKTMLNKSGKSVHPCLLPNVRGNAFSFSPMNMKLVVGLSYIAFIVKIGSLYVPFLENF